MGICAPYYTIPSDNRELQLLDSADDCSGNYTIPSDNRELQQKNGITGNSVDYTIPSDNRELQQKTNGYSPTIIIPYQVITGNYNTFFSRA